MQLVFKVEVFIYGMVGGMKESPLRTAIQITVMIVLPLPLLIILIPLPLHTESGQIFGLFSWSVFRNMNLQIYIIKVPRLWTSDHSSSKMTLVHTDRFF